MRDTTNKADAYDVITRAVLDSLEAGVVPWRKPWVTTEPLSLATGKRYNGVNMLTLGALSPYDNPYWLTFNKARELGGCVRKGEKSSVATFWKMLKVEDRETGDERTIPCLKYYRVFNAEQVDGIETPAFGRIELQEHERSAAADAIVQAMPLPPQINHGGSGAFYTPMLDEVNMPQLGRFESTDAYYHTLFHELAHATGHVSRLDRRKGKEARGKFGSASYAREELVAELAAAFVCAQVGICPMIPETSAYIDNWLQVLRDDRKLVVVAASRAQKAADWITGKIGPSVEVVGNVEPVQVAA